MRSLDLNEIKASFLTLKSCQTAISKDLVELSSDIDFLYEYQGLVTGEELTEFIRQEASLKEVHSGVCICMSFLGRLLKDYGVKDEVKTH